MTDYTIVSPPRISPAVFRQALTNRRSPALPVAEECYAVCERWGVDPAIALAFFVHESSAGTAGVARTSLNWGNLRLGPGARERRDGFAYYVSWVVSCNDFCKLLRGPLYEGAGLRTVRQVIPRYAPAADRNNPQQYADAVVGMVARWARLSGESFVTRLWTAREA